MVYIPQHSMNSGTWMTQCIVPAFLQCANQGNPQADLANTMEWRHKSAPSLNDQRPLYAKPGQVPSVRLSISPHKRDKIPSNSPSRDLRSAVNSMARAARTWTTMYYGRLITQTACSGEGLTCRGVLLLVCVRRSSFVHKHVYYPNRNEACSLSPHAPRASVQQSVQLPVRLVELRLSTQTRSKRTSRPTRRAGTYVLRNVQNKHR